MRSLRRRYFNGPVDTILTLLLVATVLLVVFAWWQWSQAAALGVTFAAGLAWTWLRVLV